MRKHIIVLLLCALFTSGSLLSCGNTEPADNPDTTADSTATDTTTLETETEGIPEDKLPELDYNGTEFNAMTRTRWFFHGELLMEESNGDVLNDARYDARITVEERLNIKMTEEYFEDNDTPRKLLQAGDDFYELFNTRHVNMFNYASEKMIHKITDLPYIDQSAPWWDKEFSDQLIVGDTQYFGMGAFNITTYDSIHMILFNKEIAEDYAVGDLYSMVLDGTWTWDAMVTAMEKVVEDTNGDGVMDQNDQYGLLSLPKQILPDFLMGGGHFMIEKDGDNFIVNNMETDEGFFNAYDKIFDMVWTDNNWYINTIDDDNDLTIFNMFSENRSLFADSTGKAVGNYRTMEVDFGILPIPKETVEQSKYYSRSEFPELQGVPLSNTDLEMTGAVLEAMSSEWFRTVKPAYFEMNLRGKIARDETSSAMLDIIYGGRVFDFGDTILCTEIRDGKFLTNMKANDRDLASTLASMKATIQTRLDLINEGFGKEG